MAAGAHAQSLTKRGTSDTTMLPVWNKASGKVEAFLELEPTGTPTAGARWRVGSTTLDAAFGLDAGDTLGLVCDRRSGLASSIGNLANHCMLAALDQDDDDRSGSRQATAGASLGRPGGKVGLTVGTGRDTLPDWLSPNNKASKFDQNTLTVYGQKNIGREATVSIGGTMAKARLIPAGDMPASWPIAGPARRSPSAPASAISAPTSSAASSTPLASRPMGRPGRRPDLAHPLERPAHRRRRKRRHPRQEPVRPGNEDQDEGTMPYVRYEQDL